MIITCSKILSFSPSIDSSSPDAVVLRNGKVVSVGTFQIIRRKHHRCRILDIPNAIVMPGLINAHTHLELPFLLDKIRAAEFSDWLLYLIAAKRKLEVTDFIYAARKNIKTAIQTGTTTIGEICTHDISPSLLEASGLRAVAYRETIKMGRAKKHQAARQRDSRLVRFGISPHTPYTVAEDILRQFATSPKLRDVHIAMHIAESKEEIRLLQRRKSGLEKLYHFAGWNLDEAPLGKSSFEYLHRTGFLSPRLLAVHAVQVTDQDIALIKESGVSIAHCPRSNRELGVGRMPLKKLLGAGIPIGLGTDSLASVPTLNMWDEMRYAYRIHKRDGITPRDIFRLATVGGAKSLGMEKETGSLEPGKKADLIAVPLPSKNTGDLYSDLLRETESCIMSIVNGKIIYRKDR